MRHWIGDTTQRQLFGGEMETAAKAYAESRLAVIERSVRPDFLDLVERSLSADRLRVAEGGKPRRAPRFTFPSSFDMRSELLGPIAEMIGVRSDRLTVCERRLIAYQGGQPSLRSPIQVRADDRHVVLIPIQVSAGCRVRLRPRGVEPALAGLKRLARRLGYGGDSPHAPRRSIALKPRDVLLVDESVHQLDFEQPGDSIFLRLCLNSCGHDPHFEDPRSAELCDRSAELLPRLADDALASLSIRLSPRVGRVDYMRLERNGAGLYRSVLVDGSYVTLSRAEYTLMSQFENPRRIDLADRGGFDSPDHVVTIVRHLMRAGLLVFDRPQQAELRLAA